ncbi:hypothetical protein EUTSA_v10012049mg [Eutrema salsugineum]|uniref:Uncharacterized protein n=1 Tax=Eutrema salsugineum TaxID=72664 RepID=V4MHZ4_EUTSA|nr:hypothetical protein EUTSA_v10012049mg [Eutrema salsugineum]
MASSKSHTVSLFATILIIFLVFYSRDKIESLGYGAIAKDRIPGCSSANPNDCIKHPANHYSRGCEISTRCRRPPITQKLYF